MACFSKPNKKKLLAESRERVENNARVLSVCVELADGELREKADKVYDTVRYMLPSAAVGAAQADKKIAASAGDLKIALSKASDRSLSHAESILKDIEAAIAERNSYTK